MDNKTDQRCWGGCSNPHPPALQKKKKNKKQGKRKMQRKKKKKKKNLKCLVGMRGSVLEHSPPSARILFKGWVQQRQNVNALSFQFSPTRRELYFAL